MLRPYQEKAINLIRDEIRKGNRKVLLALPTGAGKSHTMGHIAARSVDNGHKVLALMHRRQLVEQLAERFADCGVSSAFIMSGKECSLDCKAQVATCQTYARRMNLDTLERNPFFIDASVVFIDEAHHALNPTYKKILKHYSDKIIIGVTATPILASGLGMGNYFNALVQPISIQELISQEHLVPGVYYGPSAPDLSKLKTIAGDYEKKGLNKIMSQPRLIGDVVENWLKLAGDKRTMVFAVKVSHSKALRNEFLKHGIPAEHLDAYSNDEKREDTLRRFRDGDIQVLTNVGLYTEGTDIPELECLVLARPTKSLGLHLQMVGRGARPYPGKESFIVLDHGGNIDRLGFYEDDIIWDLDGKKSGYRQRIVRKKEKKIRTCEMCSFLHAGPRCPQCGHTIKNFGELIRAEEAELVQIGKGKRVYTTADKRRWYGMFEYERRRLEKTDKWLLAQYKTKFGVWPRGMANIGPIEPDKAVKGWLQHQRIKWNKSKQKREAAA